MDIVSGKFVYMCLYTHNNNKYTNTLFVYYARIHTATAMPQCNVIVELFLFNTCR